MSDASIPPSVPAGSEPKEAPASKPVPPPSSAVPAPVPSSQPQFIFVPQPERKKSKWSEEDVKDLKEIVEHHRKSKVKPPEPKPSPDPQQAGKEPSSEKKEPEWMKDDPPAQDRETCVII